MRGIFFLLLVLLWFDTYGQGIPEFREADSLFLQKDYDGAIKLLNQTIENRSPYLLVACYKRARAFYALKDYSRAESDLHIVLMYSPKSKDFHGLKSDSYWLLGNLYGILSKKEKSFETYKMALEYEESAALYSTTAFVAIELGKYKVALKYLNKALEKDDKYAYGYSNRAWLYLKLDKLEQAKKDVEVAILLDPNNPYAFKHRALIYLKEGKAEQACQDLHKARELGYAYFGDEPDAAEVFRLIQRNCL